MIKKRKKVIKMRKKEKTKIVLIVALTAIIFVLITGSAPSYRNVSVSFPDRNVSITAEVADNPFSREKGLMFRQSLPQDSGMAFVFEQPQKLRFWMKNTLIPLDIIFVSENFTVVNVAENAQPCSGYCPLYYSAAPAKYVVEANAGFAEKNGIKAGDSVIIFCELLRPLGRSVIMHELHSFS